MDAWRRLWVTAGSGVGLSILEDVPDEEENVRQRQQSSRRRSANGDDDDNDREDEDESEKPCEFVDGEMSLWAASLCLARELETSAWCRACLLPGAGVLELGAGAGLPSMVAALQGARLAVATEGNSFAMAQR